MWQQRVTQHKRLFTTSISLKLVALTWSFSIIWVKVVNRDKSNMVKRKNLPFSFAYINIQKTIFTFFPCYRDRVPELWSVAIKSFIQTRQFITCMNNEHWTNIVYEQSRKFASARGLLCVICVAVWSSIIEFPSCIHYFCVVQYCRGALDYKFVWGRYRKYSNWQW